MPMFGVPLKPDDKSYCSITKHRQLANLIRATRHIIWDEITTEHQYTTETVDRTCRDTADRPSGGIAVVFGGDFQKILPIVRHGSRADIVFASLLRPPLWDGIEVLKLKRNMHLANDPDARAFSSRLFDVGHRRGCSEDGTISLPRDMISLDDDAFVEETHPGIGYRLPFPNTSSIGRFLRLGTTIFLFFGRMRRDASWPSPATVTHTACTASAYIFCRTRPLRPRRVSVTALPSECHSQEQSMQNPFCGSEFQELPT